MRVDFGGTTCSQQSIVKEDGHLVDGIARCKNERHDQISSRIVVRFAQGYLTSSEYDGLAEIF